MLHACRGLGADVCVMPRSGELGGSRAAKGPGQVAGIPVLPLHGYRQLAARLALKRAFDLGAATVLLVLTAPLLIALAVVSRLQVRRPALFRQVRMVGPGKLAEIVKLRTVAGHSDPDTYWAPSGAAVHAIRLDPPCLPPG